MKFMSMKLASWDNLYLAYRMAAKGKRGRPAVSAFDYRLEDNLLQLQSELLTGEYTPGDYSSFYIHEPKRRLISAAPFRDRVVHHALCNCIGPEFEKSFVDDSYANRVGKGTHRAIERVQKYSRKFRYVLQCDVKQFFPSIDHAILKEILVKKLEPQEMALAERIIYSGRGLLTENYNMVFFKGDTLFDAIRDRGLPIGNLTSQFWANCYLNPFDHFVKRELRCPGYVRYVDDCVFFSEKKNNLWDFRKAIVDRLAHLRLTIHSGAHPRPVEEGVPFLGFVIYPERRMLKRRKGIYFRRRLKGLIEKYQDGELTMKQLNSSVAGWINHVRFSNSIGLRKAIFRECPIRNGGVK